MADQSENSADLLAKLEAAPIAERSQEFIDLLARLKAMSPDVLALAATSELNSRLTPIIGYLGLIEIGMFGPLPESMVELVRSMLRSAHEARDLYFVLVIDGINRLIADPLSNSEP